MVQNKKTKKKKFCSECGEAMMQNKKKEWFCAECGYKIEKETTQKQTLQSQKNETNTTIAICCGGAIVFFIILALIGSIDNGESGERSSSSTSKTMACIMSQELMKQTLKAPATADFASCSKSEITYLGNDKYRVSSYVDAQNSFGALIRTHYVMELEYAGNDQWKSTDLKTS